MIPLPRYRPTSGSLRPNSRMPRIAITIISWGPRPNMPKIAGDIANTSFVFVESCRWVQDDTVQIAGAVGGSGASSNLGAVAATRCGGRMGGGGGGSGRY